MLIYIIHDVNFDNENHQDEIKLDEIIQKKKEI